MSVLLLNRGMQIQEHLTTQQYMNQLAPAEADSTPPLDADDASTSGVTPGGSPAPVQEEIEDLLDENYRLKMNIAEFESSIDVIMDKHRERVQTLEEKQEENRKHFRNELEESTKIVGHLREENVMLRARLLEMYKVMQQAADVGEQAEFEGESMVEELQMENTSLRQMMGLNVSDEEVDTVAGETAAA